MPQAGTVASAAHIAGNFAAFILYDGYLGGGFEGVGNRELKSSVISKLLNNSMGCWLQIQPEPLTVLNQGLCFLRLKSVPTPNPHLQAG